MFSPCALYASYHFWTNGNSALQNGHVGKKKTTKVAFAPATSASVCSTPSSVFSLNGLNLSAAATRDGKTSVASRSATRKVRLKPDTTRKARLKPDTTRQARLK